MTHFQDGPAKDQHLMLKRAPRFLRVVEQDGQWDALDQITDTPRPREKVHAYEIVGVPGMCHVNIAGGRGGMFVAALYAHCPVQPSDAEMRGIENWRAWCEEKAEARTP